MKTVLDESFLRNSTLETIVFEKKSGKLHERIVSPETSYYGNTEGYRYLRNLEFEIFYDKPEKLVQIGIDLICMFKSNEDIKEEQFVSLDDMPNIMFGIVNIKICSNLGTVTHKEVQLKRIYKS